MCVLPFSFRFSSCILGFIHSFIRKRIFIFFFPFTYSSILQVGAGGIKEGNSLQILNNGLGNTSVCMEEREKKKKKGI